MKKKLLVLLTVLVMLVGSIALTGCGEKEQEFEPGTDHTYKDAMLPFEDLIPAERLVILQNTLNFGMTGFYTAETAPVTESITYNGAAVDAYPITYTLDFLTNEVKGDVTVTDVDGNDTVYSAEEFAGMYAIVDFMSYEPVVLYNPTTGAETTIKAAKTSEGEAIYSITADSVHPTADMLTACGWTADETLRLVATDKFYIPVDPEYLAIGELRGTLSGALTASFADMVIASGKLNDPVYFEVIVEE